MKRMLPMLSVVLILGTAGTAQQSLEDQFKSLKDAYSKEEKKYYDELRAKADRGEAVSFTDGPAKSYLPKAMQLARKAKGTAIADQAYAWAAGMAYQTANPDSMAEAFEGMIANNPNSNELKTTMMLVGYGIRDKDKAVKLLSRIEHFSKDKEIKASAVMMRAGLFYDDYSGEGDVQRAKGILNRVLENYRETEAAKRAKRAIYAMENLGVGMVAPDFTATDQDGVEFKLSDYRGKVVVVGFWGFW